MIQQLIEQGFTELEARMHIATYNCQAEQMFDECNCEEV